MQTATGGGDVEAQAAMVRELGFDGVAWDLKDLAAMRRACEVRNGDLLSANAVVDVATLDGDTNATAIAPGAIPLANAADVHAPSQAARVPATAIGPKKANTKKSPRPM